MMECRNYFLIPGGIHVGNYTINDGSILLPFLTEGQYFLICGSLFNDGVHLYKKASYRYLEDETFTGTIWALSPPSSFIKLSEEIQEWRQKNEEKVMSPFQSESFAGYSYSKGTESAQCWQDAFAARIARWRKL